MTPGARIKFGASMFEPEVFRKQMYCIEVLVTLLGLFGALPQSFGAPRAIRRPGNCTPLAPRRYVPGLRFDFVSFLSSVKRVCIDSQNVNNKYCIVITPVEQNLSPGDYILLQKHMFAFC